MPVTKGSQAYNASLARNIATRQIAYFVKMSKSRSKGATKASRAAAKETAQQFKQLKAATYRVSRGKASQEEMNKINEAIAHIRSLAGSARIARGRNGAANLSTQMQINLASKTYRDERGKVDESRNPSIYTKSQVKVFYRVTQQIWQSSSGPTDMTQINRKIMRYFNTNSLEEAMDRALSSKSAIKALAIAAKQEDTKLTPEQQELYDEALKDDNEDNKTGSPNYLNFVIEFDQNKKWDENDN